MGYDECLNAYQGAKWRKSSYILAIRYSCPLFTRRRTTPSVREEDLARILLGKNIRSLPRLKNGPVTGYERSRDHDLSHTMANQWEVPSTRLRVPPAPTDLESVERMTLHYKPATFLSL